MNRRKIISKIQRRAFEGFFQGLAFAADSSKRQKKAQKICSVTNNAPYCPDANPARTLDIYRRIDKDGPMPVLIYIHGGGFTLCSKETHRAIARAYAYYGGFVVFNMDYRLAPRHPYPAAIEDACLAYEWVVANAPRFGGDLSRIVVAGESAGGNLALALSVAATHKRPEPFAQRAWNAGIAPKAALILCGLLQVSDPARFAQKHPGLTEPMLSWSLQTVGDVSRAYLGRECNSKSEMPSLADPLLIMESDALPDRPFPSVFAMVGTRDILLDDTKRLEQALIIKNMDHLARYYQGEGHAFQAIPWRKQAMQFWRDNFEFLAQRLKQD
ncbi:MAG: alpha/beta hydrolase [Desulfatibacillaceae bacterium]|nr:alpha/beta hydrolase [Desulfatibacillaceae bacterium]